MRPLYCAIFGKYILLYRWIYGLPISTKYRIYYGLLVIGKLKRLHYSLVCEDWRLALVENNPKYAGQSGISSIRIFWGKIFWLPMEKWLHLSMPPFISVEHFAFCWYKKKTLCLYIRFTANIFWKGFELIWVWYAAWFLFFTPVILYGLLPMLAVFKLLKENSFYQVCFSMN